MKSKIISLLGCTLCLTYNIHTKSVMPKISRLKDKVDKALENEQTTSFRELFEHAKKNQKNDGTLTIVGPSKNPGKETKDLNNLSDFEETLFIIKLEKKITNALWSNSTELIETLKAFMTPEEKLYKEALTIVNDMVTEKHGGNQYPLFSFIKNLETEKEMLQESNNDVFKLLTRNHGQKETLNELLQKTQTLKKNINELIHLVETILLRQ